MPKHGKRRTEFGMYSRGVPLAPIPPVFPNPMMMPPAMMPPMMMPPMMPPPMFGVNPQVMRPELNSSRNLNRPHDEDKPVPAPLSKEELACLPFFKEELRATADREPTDIVIMDFDRTLLATPCLNQDLLNKPARQLLETKLEWGNTWWQNPDVLHAAVKLDRWDATLVDIACASSEEPNVLLVITTARTTDSIAYIKEVLSQKGISHIDHISCSASSQLTTGSNSKEKMFELLLDTYESLERIFVIDSNKMDANRYTKAATRFVQEGWLNSEAFYVVDKILTPSHLPLMEERQLIQKVLMKSSLPLDTHILEQSPVYRLTLDSRKELVNFLINKLPQDVEFDYIECQQAEIAQNADASIERQTWIADELQLIDKQGRLQLRSISNANIVITVLVGKLKSFLENRTISMNSDNIIVHTYTYEPRRLEVMLTGSSK